MTPDLKPGQVWASSDPHCIKYDHNQIRVVVSVTTKSKRRYVGAEQGNYGPHNAWIEETVPAVLFKSKHDYPAQPQRKVWERTRYERIQPARPARTVWHHSVRSLDKHGHPTRHHFIAHSLEDMEA